ncbi:hypothetical protein GCM10010964_19240 [Caldovatus sediminis]|uniref:Uncharacterized protein n=1 Tax=Caldovatus sediminis TaxID=2041189 RepID=A0A8J2ZB28_9PROT|nr:STY0301 family protein [Caldovatus sediminis]GGG31450.1 hypothetical protein GCM10010964_19240 [Caldovatus sediminis]
MTATPHRLRFAAAACALAVPLLLPSFAGTARGQPQALACPDRLAPSGPGDPRFEQIGPPPAAAVPLRGARMFDGPPGEEQEPEPMEVQPNRLGRDGRSDVRGWPVALHGSGLLLVCLYARTDTYLRAMVPRELDRCEIASRPGGGVAVTCR